MILVFQGYINKTLFFFHLNLEVIMTTKRSFRILFLFLPVFFLTSFVNAMTTIQEIDDPETPGGKRLSVVSPFKVPGQERNFRLRTILFTDVEVAGKPGPVSLLRSDPEGMKAYSPSASGVRTRTHEQTRDEGYIGIWGKRLKTRTAEGYNPSTLFIIEEEIKKEDAESKSSPQYATRGYFGLGNNSATEWIILAQLFGKQKVDGVEVENVQGKGIMKSVMGHVLTVLIPDLRENPLTAHYANRQWLLATVGHENEMWSQAIKAAFDFSHRMGAGINYNFTTTEPRPNGEHQFRIDLRAYYENAGKRHQDAAHERAKVKVDPEA